MQKAKFSLMSTLLASIAGLAISFASAPAEAGVDCAARPDHPQCPDAGGGPQDDFPCEDFFPVDPAECTCRFTESLDGSVRIMGLTADCEVSTTLEIPGNTKLDIPVNAVRTLIHGNRHTITVKPGSFLDGAVITNATPILLGGDSIPEVHVFRLVLDPDDDFGCGSSSPLTAIKFVGSTDVTWGGARDVIIDDFNGNGRFCNGLWYQGFTNQQPPGNFRAVQIDRIDVLEGSFDGTGILYDNVISASLFQSRVESPSLIEGNSGTAVKFSGVCKGVIGERTQILGDFDTGVEVANSGLPHGNGGASNECSTGESILITKVRLTADTAGGGGTGISCSSSSVDLVTNKITGYVTPTDC